MKMAHLTIFIAVHVCVEQRTVDPMVSECNEAVRSSSKPGVLIYLADWLGPRRTLCSQAPCVSMRKAPCLNAREAVW